MCEDVIGSIQPSIIFCQTKCENFVFRKTLVCRKPTSQERAANTIIRNEYEKLGKMRFVFILSLSFTFFMFISDNIMF